MKNRAALLTSQKGMTLAEIMVAAAFSIFLTAGVMSFASFFNNAQYEYQSHVELTNDCRQIIEKMVWGYKEAGVAQRRGIAEAVTGTIVSTTQFRYTDVSGTQYTLRSNNGNIEYQRGSSGTWTTLLDPNGTSVAYDATKYTTSLAFTAPTTNNSVIVRVVVGKNILGKWYYGSSSTQVFYRNA